MKIQTIYFLNNLIVFFIALMGLSLLLNRKNKDYDKDYAFRFNLGLSITNSLYFTLKFMNNQQASIFMIFILNNILFNPISDMLVYLSGYYDNKPEV